MASRGDTNSLPAGAIPGGDLLAERAGIALGFGQHQPHAAAYRLISDLCIKAGADETLIPRWAEAGRRRAETASAIPYSG